MKGKHSFRKDGNLTYWHSIYCSGILQIDPFGTQNDTE